MSGASLRYVLFLVGSYAILFDMVFWESGVHGLPASAVGHILQNLSPRLISSKVLYWTWAFMFHVSALCWVFSIKRKVASFLVAISFLTCSSLYIENLILAQTHIFQPLSYAFIILYLKDCDLIKYDRYLIASFVSLTFFHSGVEKIVSDGQWWEASNIQTIFHLFAKNSVLSDLVLNNSLVARSVGQTVLAYELSCFLPVIIPRLFYVWGCFQLIFLLGVAVTFHWFFYPMVILIVGYYCREGGKEAKA